MPDGAQLDLVDWLAATKPAAPAPAPCLPSKSWEWDRRIAGCQAERTVTIHVSEQWTGVVLEQVNDPELGMMLLWHTGRITEYPHSASMATARVIHMTAEGVARLAKQMPVTEHDRGEGYVRYRIKQEAQTNG